MNQHLLTSFEQERDDLLARYEASPAFRPLGDYTPDQFAGRRRAYLPRLQALLQAYAQAYPHFREVLGLELTRPRRVQAGGRLVAYEFDGLLLPERLARRVGRLKLPPHESTFPALQPLRPPDKGLGALQQRSHFEWALKIAGQLAGATTRDLLTGPTGSGPPQVASALRCLRAFGPDDSQLPRAVGEAPGLEQWWRGCGLTASRSELQATMRADQLAAFTAYSQQLVPELPAEQAAQLLAAAVTAEQTGRCSRGFSPAFYWCYFTCVVIPAEYYAPEMRVPAAVAILYQLADYSTNEPAKPAKRARREALHVLELLTADAAPTRHKVVALFFAELTRQLQALPAAERLQRHLALSRLSRHPSLVHTFYQAVGTHLDAQDMEERERAGCLLQLAQALNTDARLQPARPELAACAAAACRQLYEELNLSTPEDQRTLQRLYALLVHCLEAAEITTLEELILEEIAEHPASAGQWLAAEGELAHCLRQRLRQQAGASQTLFGSHEYAHCARLLVAYTPANEVELNHQLFAARYDTQYFMQIT